uniref:Uncharacterized protein n=1 Tax=Coccidioides posadasii RMSCC 3488 TaxID=454284 RepID=A0A0J6EWP5_COCPO|nr:hypothetical protein CPAG_01338 [Coccidioides posadasii RMSCC 3488]
MQMQTRLFEKFLSLAEYASYFLNKALGAIAARGRDAKQPTVFGVSTKSKQKPRNRITIISSSAPSELSTSERAIPVHSAWVSPTNSDLPGRKYCPVVSVDFHASPTREPRVCLVPASRRYKKKAGRFTHKRWNHAEKEKDFLTPAKLRDRS